MTDTERKAAARQFAADWQGRGDEKQETQSFWLALLRNVYGVADPEKFIDFEVRVKLDHTSFIDGLIRETRVLIEQKGKDIDLHKGATQSDGSFLNPFQQARRYAGYLPHDQNPRWIVVCNFQTFEIHDMNRPNDEPEVVALADLEKEYHRLQFLVDTGDENIKKEMEISLQAGEIVGVLYDALLKQYKDPTDPETLKSLNALCVRLVFCLYAEDAGIFGGHGMFHHFLQGYNLLNAYYTGDYDDYNEIESSLYDLLDRMYTELGEDNDLVRLATSVEQAIYDGNTPLVLDVLNILKNNCAEKTADAYNGLPFVEDNVIELTRYEQYNTGMVIDLNTGYYGLYDHNTSEFLYYPNESCYDCGADMISIEKDGYYGSVYYSGESAIGCYYEEPLRFNKNGLSAVKSNGMYGAIDKTGQKILPTQYTEVDFVGDSFLVANTKNSPSENYPELNQFAIFDNLGNQITDHDYASFTIYEDKWLLAEYIDLNGNEVIKLSENYGDYYMIVDANDYVCVMGYNAATIDPATGAVFIIETREMYTYAKPRLIEGTNMVIVQDPSTELYGLYDGPELALDLEYTSIYYDYGRECVVATRGAESEDYYSSYTDLRVNALLNHEDAAGDASTASADLIINYANLNARSEPNTNSEILGEFSTGTIMEYASHNDGWYEVSYNGQTCYVSGNYVISTTKERINNGSVGLLTTTTNVEIMAGPGTRFVVSGREDAGYDMVYDGTVDNYYRVIYDDDYAYVPTYAVEIIDCHK